MADDQEMVDVEVVDVETANEGMLEMKEEDDMENIENIDNIVVIAAEDMKEEENALTIAEEGEDITVKEEEDEEGEEEEEEEVDEKDDINGESTKVKITKPTGRKAPTFADALKNDFPNAKPNDDNGISPICIEALNSDNNVADMKTDVASAEEGEKRKRKRVPRKIQKVEVNENGEPIENKPYKCEMCHWQFKQRYRFKRHMRTHTGERPYQCPQCDKQFSRSHILKVHMMIHTGEKPFICEECGWSFMKKYHLQRHMRTHTGEMPFVCQECGVHFSRQYYLKKHLVSAHGATIVVKRERRKPKTSTSPDATTTSSENPEKCIEVVCTIEVDPTQIFNDISGKLEDGSEIYPADENGMASDLNDEDEVTDTDQAKDENGSKLLSEERNIHSPPPPPPNQYCNIEIQNTTELNSQQHHQQTGTVSNTQIQDGTTVITENQNQGIINTQNQNSYPVHNASNQNGATINFPIQNGGNTMHSGNQNGIYSSSNQSGSTMNSASQHNSEASLKECIEMVNQLVERKPMETMVIRRDVENLGLNMNNETESHLDVDFHSIPVK